MAAVEGAEMKSRELKKRLASEREAGLGRGRRGHTVELRGAVASYVREERLRGRTDQDIASELGASRGALARWAGPVGSGSECRGSLVPIAVRRTPPREMALGSVGARCVIVGPRGLQVLVADLSAAAELLERLGW